MAFFQGPVPGHFAILQAKIGLKMAELDCFQNCSVLTIKKSQNLKELQGPPWPNQALSMVLGEGPNWSRRVLSKKFKICDPPFYKCFK